ncbi:MAG: tetratricopeptide repeat protein [Bryobacteraceae bacterium]
MLPARMMTGQGNTPFRITTSNPKAQEFFNQGVAQLHSFWAVEAERSFLQAAQLDPQAPMPQWGIAMVAAGDYRPRFQLGSGRRNTNDARAPQGGAARAQAAAKKALELSAAPGKATELEKMYIAAIAARRDRKSKDADKAYIAGLRAIVEAYPDEVEAKTYLALHLMQGFVTPTKTPREGSMEAAQILRELLVKAPDHAGVHHYVIHGFEGSTFAKDAWPSCRRYPELTSNIPHALHMPGHIWAQTGKWEEAAASFESAAQNERGYMKADKLYTRGHHGHNVHFLITTYSFQGRYDKAVEAAQELLAMKENPREAGQIDNALTAYRQGWLGLLRSMVQSEKWDEILAGQTLPVYDKPREQAWRHWALAQAHVAKGNLEAAKSETQAMEAAMKLLKSKTKQKAPLQLQVARKELEGQLALAANKTDKGLNLLQAAVRQERALRYQEPPAYPRPVAEVLGQKALQAGKLAVAANAFRQALEQYPESSRARAGLAEVQKRDGRVVAGGL